MHYKPKMRLLGYPTKPLRDVPKKRPSYELLYVENKVLNVLGRPGPSEKTEEKTELGKYARDSRAGYRDAAWSPLPSSQLPRRR